jgi:hypothetical protein
MVIFDLPLTTLNSLAADVVEKRNLLVIENLCISIILNFHHFLLLLDLSRITIQLCFYYKENRMR